LRSEQGSAVVGSLAGILLTSLIFTSTLGLIFSGYNLLIIKEIAVSAARHGALADKSAVDAERYALRLLKDSIPRLAEHEVSASSNQGLVLVQIRSNLAGVGLLENWITGEVRAMASKENAS